MKVFSGKANQLLSQIDGSLKTKAKSASAPQPGGITKAELSKLDQNKDGQISRSEAPGLNRQELSVFNQALKGGRAATEVVFVRELASQPGTHSENSFLSRLLKKAPANSNAPTYRPVTDTPVVNHKSEGSVKGVAKGTGYYPANTKMQGGFVDKVGKPLRTLQDFLEGKSSYVSIALDKNLYKTGQIKYGDSFRIPELEAKYGRKIVFKAVDTGGAFTNKGFGRVDICTRSQRHSIDSTINGRLTLIKTP